MAGVEQFDRDGGALARRTVDLGHAMQERHALAHAEQAQRLVRIDTGRVEATAIFDSPAARCGLPWP